jgi:predicted secreted protein
MPRSRFALVPVILAALLAGPALAAGPAPTDDPGMVLHLVEQVERQLPRDRLSAVLQVEAKGLEPAAVQAEVNQRMQAALARAKSATAVQVASGGYSVYRQPPPNNAGPDQWFASQTLSLTATDFAPALKLIGELQGDGLAIEALTFEVAPQSLRAAQEGMSDEALAALRARAEHVAAAMGMAVARYKTLDVGNVIAQDARPPMPLRIMKAATIASAPPPAVAEAGDATATLTVNAEVILDKK